jgi:Spy/CpxP family protein refolding chaperone
MIEEERMMRLNLKKMSGFIVIAASLLLATVIGFSQQGRPAGPPPGGGFRGGPGPRDGLGPLARDLNLSDEQKTQIKKITESFEESTKALRDQMRTLHEGQPDPLSGGTFDEAAVRAAAQARANVEIELEVAHARMMSQVFAVLTAEQKAQLAAKRQEFEQRRHEGPPRGDVPNN